MSNMIKSISTALNEISQLSYVAHCHKDDCRNENCGVSLFVLKQIAIKTRQYAYKDELAEIDQLIQNWPK